MSIKSIKRVLFILAIIVFVGIVPSVGQPGGGDDDGEPPGNPVPISGIGYLLALGGALGIKKIYDIRKSKDDT